MLYPTLLLVHVAGALALGAGIVGGLRADERARRAPTPGQLDEALELAGRWQRRVLIPGTVALLASGVGLVVLYYGWAFVALPWLAAMALLYVVEAVRANTLTRRHAVRLAELAGEARARGRFPPELERVRRDRAAAFLRWLELTVFLLVVALGLYRPMEWSTIAVGAAAALLAPVVPAIYVAKPELAAVSSFRSASVDGDGRT